MLSSEEDKGKLVIDLIYNQHKSYRKINEEYGFSFNEISSLSNFDLTTLFLNLFRA
jgi:hypothetical protein